MLLCPTLLKRHGSPLFIIIASVVLYFLFAYHLRRTDYTMLLFLYSALFFLFYKLVQTCKHRMELLIYTAFLFRAGFILSMPNLSQDFYRFIWDGRMILEGFNPYLYTVESFINNGEFPVAQAPELYVGMGVLNASHFTNYPPIHQLCFIIAGFFAGKSILGSVVVMRLLIIAADFGTFYFGKKLLEKLNIPVYNIFWYLLNPLIIIELTGNLHFESVMLFFLVWSLYLLHIGKWKFAAVVLALSISIKLVPFMFLPLFFQWFVKPPVISTFKKKENINEIDSNKQIVSHDFLARNPEKEILRFVSFGAIVILTTLLLFVPFYSPGFVNNYINTTALWFQKFEFNASLYYIARAIGHSFTGYNEIVFIGKITPVIVISFILILSFFRKNRTTVQLVTAMLWALSFYYFTATTVHPWYLATLLLLSVFTNYKFSIVWTFMIILSYLAYLHPEKADASENLWLIALEYLVVFSVFLYEVLKIQKNKSLSKNYGGQYKNH